MIRIAYYVTSHGYGHMNRAAAVVAALPRDVPVVVTCSSDLFDGWREAMGQRARLREGRFDCGAVHPAGDSSGVDARATLDGYASVHAAADLGREVEFLRTGRFGAAVSDAASLPLAAAAAAGVPGILLANFTWCDIFRPYVRRFAEYAGLLAQMRREYSTARLYLRAEPALRTQLPVPALEPGLVARRGRRRRGELVRALGLDRQARLAYLYVGRYGQDDIAWSRLSRLGFEFVTYHRLAVAPANWHAVDPRHWPPRDIAASVDVMVAKAGYGTVTDAMVHGTPLVYPPRSGFAEHRVLDAGLRLWGGGVPVRARAFRRLDLARPLERALRLRPGPPPWSIEGARRAAREISRIARDHG